MKIKNKELNEKVTIKNMLLKVNNDELSLLEFIRQMKDMQYMEDAMEICRSCGISGIHNDTPGAEQCAISMSTHLCKDSSINKRIFRLLAEDVDLGWKDFFPNCSDDEAALIFKPDGIYEIVRIPYRNEVDVFLDLELLAIIILAKSEPELELLSLADFLVELIGNISGRISEKPVKPDYQNGAEKNVIPYPHIIHGDIDFPTHTHGLNEIGWPEFMINARCYGYDVNAVVINAVYDYFNTPERKKELNKVFSGETIEVPINKLCSDWDWQGLDYPVCFRLVPNTFEGVKSAYESEDGVVDPNLMVVQIYVKGDDFALTDEYYRNEI